MKLTNKGARRLGVPGRPAIILDPGKSVTLDEKQLAHVRKNRTIGRWLDMGVLELSDGAEPAKVEVTKPVPSKKQPVQQPKPIVADDREVINLPGDVTGEGTETHHAGGGWYEVYVNGFKVTDRKVRKDEAASIAAEYD